MPGIYGVKIVGSGGYFYYFLSTSRKAVENMAKQEESKGFKAELFYKSFSALVVEDNMVRDAEHYLISLNNIRERKVKGRK